MLHSINKGESKTIPRVAINPYGLPINLNTATISVVAKQFGDGATILFTKLSSDTNQIQVLNEAKGIYLLKITAGNTSGLSDRTLYCTQTIVKGGKTYTEVFYLKIKGNSVSANGVSAPTTTEMRHGTTAERLTYGASLTSLDRIAFFDDDNNTPYFWNGTGWA